MKGTFHYLIAGATSLVVGSAAAMGASASFGIDVEVRKAPDRCISGALSQLTHAEVQVVCATGQFVDIVASPGRAFLGTQGAAFRYVLDPAGFVPSDLLLKGELNGTVTSLRVYNGSAEQGPLEMLVSF